MDLFSANMLIVLQWHMALVDKMC